MDERTKKLIKEAVAEDLGDGDRTSIPLGLSGVKGRGRLLAKGKGVFFGKEVFEAVFFECDPKCFFLWRVEDGGRVTPGDIVADFEGPLSALLAAERTALNFVQHLSGVATRAAEFVKAVEGTGVILLDTRKTTPGMRLLEKAAVAAGGMKNHRMGLYDMVLLKENHLAAAGGMESAVRAVREMYGNKEFIEVEVRTLEELKTAIDLGVSRVLLDNMDVGTLKKAVELAGGKVELEASGGVRLDSVRDIAATGVDYISIGEVTHSAPVLDLSILLEGA